MASTIYAGASGGISVGSSAAFTIPVEATAVPRTVATAVGRLDALNQRLNELRALSYHLSDQIGGPRPASGQIKGEAPSPMGAVGRLNDATDAAHETLSDIEETLKAIARALG